ncbi:sigma-54-dependent Fis family transcriptional regulator [candidate division KSB1 bacterium]|nr:sigma-54-dependent Fis family transcriptional regulator [candidate division KSB1 bacterium]
MARKLNILVADDEESIRLGFEQLLSRDGYNFTIVDDGEKALQAIEKTDYDIIFLDFKMPLLDGIEVLKQIKQRSIKTEVVIITAYGTIKTAVEAIKLGAYDYITKPFLPDTIRKVINKIIEKKNLLSGVSTRNLEIEYGDNKDIIIGVSPKMQEIYELIHKVAPTDSTVLITGESGTGKELIAKAIHYNSLRKEKPFLTVDCGSLVETLFESELFGHVKGSFTGAIATKHGSFELAHQGTFFLDEISNISLSIQAKILRAIQEKEIKRVGATDMVKVDVRVLAATNIDLRKLVDEGKFREDLFYRLSVIPIYLPALRERKEDILPLAFHFLKKYNMKRKRKIEAISEAVQKILLAYNWPGNVRELENVIERAVVIEDMLEITTASLPTHLQEIENTLTGKEVQENIRSLDELEREHIQKVLRATNGNRSKSARILGIDRKTLYDKLKRYQIE